jgi:hypothetical protein
MSNTLMTLIHGRAPRLLPPSESKPEPAPTRGVGKTVVIRYTRSR